MNKIFQALGALSLLLLSGCVFPGDAIIPPVKLYGSVADPDAKNATVAQLDRHASRKELLAFTSGKLPTDVDSRRVVHTTVTGGAFSAEFGLFMEPSLVWLLPPLGFRPASDIFIRLDSAQAQTYVLRDPPFSHLYRISTATGALVRCSPNLVEYPQRSTTHPDAMSPRIVRVTFSR